MKMTFGKYKGWEVWDIPVEYLQWLIKNVELKNSELRNAIAEVVDFVGPVDAIVIAGIYRSLAKKWHPDKGGTNEAMAAINDFYSAIKDALTVEVPE